MSKRPGTVDYSKWDHFGSDSESEDDDHDDIIHDDFEEPDNVSDSDAEEDYEDSEEDSDYVSESDEDEDDDGSEDDDGEHHPDHPQLRVRHITIPPPTLADLQYAWYRDTSDSAHCSRCQLVRYCNLTCQREYQAIHKLECIDAGQHALFWGAFDKKKGESDGIANTEGALKARRSSKRRRALQRAAAAGAVERARRAREARGAGGKGGGKGKGAEEREEECSICMCDFTVQGDGGVAFCCPTSHYMCQECSGTWDLDASYPPKCPMCKALMSKDHFERQLTSEQQNTFRAHAARTTLKPGDELIECKECRLFEVITDDPVLWWCPHCGCRSCRVCNKDLPTGAMKYDIEKSPHHSCVKLREPKALIEQAIEEGSKMHCPCCKLAGRKDDACTHMTCTKCATEWCYVCGVSVRNCDKAPPQEGGRVNDIYLHNRDWEHNEKRCPMYLTQILEIDLNWLGENWEENARDEDFADDERCLDYLHRFKTIKLLQDVRARIGPKSFIEAFVTFDSIKNCGYTCNEIISTCTDKLIDRGEDIHSREDDEESEGNIGGEAFANILERQQIEMALEATAHVRDADGGEDDEIDPDELEQQLVTQAMQRSAESTAEDDLVREVMARSAESQGDTISELL